MGHQKKKEAKPLACLFLASEFTFGHRNSCCWSHVASFEFTFKHSCKFVDRGVGIPS